MDSDKRKRLTIPIVTLIVGIVMMSGVGYAALTSTFEVTENSTVGAKLEVKIEDKDLVGGKILKDVKIPYAVNTTNGVKSYHVEHGYMVLKTVPIIATDGMNHGKYKMTVEISLPKSVDTNIVQMHGIVEQIEDGKTMPVTGAEIKSLENLSLKILLLYLGGEKITDPSILNIGDITIKITLSYA